jgi:hypothetical protein
VAVVAVLAGIVQALVVKILAAVHLLKLLLLLI